MIAFSRKAASYFSRPRLRSHTAKSKSMTAPSLAPFDNQPEVAVCLRKSCQSVNMPKKLRPGDRPTRSFAPTITEEESAYQLIAFHGLSTPRSRANCSISFPKVGTCVRRSIT